MNRPDSLGIFEVKQYDFAFSERVRIRWSTTIELVF